MAQNQEDQEYDEYLQSLGLDVMEKEDIHWLLKECRKKRELAERVSKELSYKTCDQDHIEREKNSQSYDNVLNKLISSLQIAYDKSDSIKTHEDKSIVDKSGQCDGI